MDIRKSHDARRTAILVNGDPEQRVMLSQLLEKDDWKVTSCPDIEEAFKCLEQQSAPDLIVTALHRPDVDVLEFCRLLRSATWEQFNRTPILVVSATSAEAETRRITQELGSAALLSRPLDTTTFLDTASGLLREQALLSVKNVLEERAAELRKQEELYRVAVESQSELICKWLSDTTLTFVNEAFCRFFGQSRQQLLGRKFVDLVSEPTRAQVLDTIELFLKAPHATSREREILFPGPLPRWFRWTDRALVDEKGNVTEFLCVGKDITYIKEMEKALLVEAAEKDLLIESVPVHLWYLINVTTYGRINQTHADFLGLPKERVEFRSVYECHSEEEASLCEKSNIEVFTTAQPLQTEEWLVNKRGEARLLAITKMPHLDEQGNVKYVVCSGIDITEQRQAEDVLKEREEQLDLFFNQSLDGFFFMMIDEPVLWDDTVDKEAVLDYVFDHQRITKANDAVLAQYGMTAEQFLGYTANEIFAHDIPQGRTVLRELLDAGHLHKHTLERKLDGTPVWIEGDYICLYDAEGRVTGHFGIQRDITDRKNAERDLKESRERLNLALQGADLGTWDWDIPSGTIIFNDRWVTMLGYEPGEIAPHISSWKSLVHPDDLALAEETLATHLDGHTPFFECEYRMRTKDNRWMWILDKGRVIERDEHGKPCRALGTHLDITQNRHFHDERVEMQRRLSLSQKRESLGVMAGAVAHRFNNLLMVILGNFQILELGRTTPEQMASSLNEAREAALEAADLSRTMLTYLGQGIGAPASCDLSAEVKRVMSLIEVSMPSNARLSTRLAKGLPHVKADPGSLRQVTMNLVTNACEALGDDQGIVTISTGRMHCDEEFLKNAVGGEARPAGEYVYLEVADNGCGMDESALARIFDPFFTTKFTGRGLGLPSVLGIVRSAKGAIHVSSQPRSGTTIRILLPAIVAAKESPEPPPAKPRRDWRGSGTVLLVEDEAPVRNIARLMLERIGFDVIAVSSGPEAVQVIGNQEQPVTCVLCDLTMPQMDGWETLQAIREIRPNMPVVLTSGYDEAHALLGKTLPPYMTFLQKPFEQDTVKSVMRKALA